MILNNHVSPFKHSLRHFYPLYKKFSQKNFSNEQKNVRRRNDNNFLKYNLKIVQKLRSLSEEDLDRIFYSHFIIKKCLQKAKRKSEEQKLVSLPPFELPKDFKITVTSNPREVSAWVNENILQSANDDEPKIIGMDREGEILYIRDSIPKNLYHVCLLQLSTKTSCLLFRTKSGNVAPPQELIDMFHDNRIKKVWVGLSNDMNEVNNWMGMHNIPQIPHSDLSSLGFVDLCKAVKLLPEIPPKFQNRILGIVALCELLFSQKFEKDGFTTFSRWTKKELSEAQIRYAAKDAYFSCVGYHKLMEMLKK